jgi:hypothetical protein
MIIASMYFVIDPINIVSDFNKCLFLPSNTMEKMNNKKLKYILSICSICLFLSPVFSQNKAWKKELSKDGTIAVEYIIYDEEDASGDDIQIIEYKSTTTHSLSYENCIKMMKDISNHKDFSDDTEDSYKIKDISNNECLVYYYIDAPWPMPNADCVSVMNIIEDPANNSIRFELEASPDLYEMQDVKRMTLSFASYEFKKINENDVAISIYTKFAPVAAAPDWLVKTWFPKGPVEIMENIIALVESE